MYVSHETYASMGGSVSGEDYAKAAPIADAVIDDWTLGRVGRAVSCGEALPDVVSQLYVSIVDSVPGVMSGSKVEGGAQVSSFSNGVDSYSFNTDKDVSDQLRSSLGWMLELLPVEWCSACVPFEGGNAYAG